MISFEVIGDPKGQPRPRAFARRFGNKWSARVFDAGTAEGWKSQIALAARPHIPAEPLTCPLHVTLSFRLSRPRSHFGSGKNEARLKESAPLYHTGTPDLDNLAKAVLDCMTKLGFWADDAQIIVLTVAKDWGPVAGMSVLVEKRGPLPTARVCQETLELAGVNV